MSVRPLWPPVPPPFFSFTVPGGRSSSSCTTSIWPGSMRWKCVNEATQRPLSFMYVSGLSSQNSWPPSSTRVVQPENLDCFDHDARLRPAMASTHQKPALCRVASYFLPGLPRPTMRRMSSMKNARL